MKKFHENEEVVFEQPIPYRSPIDPLDRVAVLSYPKTKFTPCFEPAPRANPTRMAQFFGERGWMVHEFMQISQRVSKGGAIQFELTREAIGELSRACRQNPSLFREIYGREMPS